ncbi:class I adenylate-forming enzyme family protein [Pseudonocardia lacus]|uniref:class I adenylate-forming enzyme family protein n=1 Tax=Pseudonocardia lacus TaxID=2835865 RepID=UPI001BDC0CD6|nr:AMP-binding protein [Pseudonocardia lacus]
MEDTVLTIPGLVQRAAREHPDHDSFVFPHARQTYGELEESAVAVAAALTALGVRPGDAVGTLMPNGLDFVHVMIGTAMVGALFVPINARLAPREIAHIVPDSGMKVLFTTDAVDEHVDYVARLGQAFPELAAGVAGETPPVSGAPALRTAVVLGTRTAPGFRAGEQFLALGRDVDTAAVRAAAAAVTPDSRYIMMYTSGTTAEPKGCPLTHRSVVGLGKAVGEQAFGVTGADRMWNPLPMFHVSAQAPMVAVLNAGATYVSMTHFETDAALELIEREQATLLYPAYPTLTGPLLAHPSYGPDTFRRVRALLTVGPPDLLRGFQDKLPHTSHVSCYGSTETGGVAVMGRLDDPLEERLTSGKPFAGVEVQVRDPLSGEQVAPGEVGVLHMRGFNLFLGYHNDPVKTAASFDAEGWFFTGDLASVDANGNLTFRGRTKDMLKVGGENVGCLEVEAYLTTHPDIQLASVVGVPDPRYDEVPAAFVELRSGARLSEDEVIAFCRSGLAKYKVPRYVRFTTEWPMSATKIQKFRLRDRLLAELAPSGAGEATTAAAV